MSKIIRIDRQGVFQDLEFDSKESLRKYLIDLHTQDHGWLDGEDDPAYLETCSLDKLCSVFEWRYEEI